jgi:hypothetical protein
MLPRYTLTEGRLWRLRLEMLMMDFYSTILCRLCRRVWKNVDGADWNTESGRKYISSLSVRKRSKLFPDLIDMVERGTMEDWDITMLSQLIRDLYGRSEGKAIDNQTVNAVEALNKLRNELMHKSRTEISNEDTFIYLWKKMKQHIAQILGCLGESDEILELACRDILLARSDEVDRLNLDREIKLRTWTDSAVNLLHKINIELSSKIVTEAEVVNVSLGSGRAAEDSIPVTSQREPISNANCLLCGQRLDTSIKAKKILAGRNPGAVAISDRSPEDFAENQIAHEISKSIHTLGNDCDGTVEDSSHTLSTQIDDSRYLSTPQSGQIPYSQDSMFDQHDDGSDSVVLESDASTHVGAFSDDSESDVESEGEIGAIHSLYPVSENFRCMQLLEEQIMKTLKLNFRKTFKQMGDFVKSEKMMASLMSDILDAGYLQHERNFFDGSPLIDTLSSIIESGMVHPEHKLRFWRIMANLADSELKYLENLKVLSNQGIFEVVRKVPTKSHVAFVRMTRFAAEVVSCILHTHADLRAALHSIGISLIVFASSAFGVVSMGPQILIPSSLLQHAIALANRNHVLKAAVVRMATKASAIDISVPLMDNSGAEEALPATTEQRSANDSPLHSSIESLTVLAHMQQNILLDLAENLNTLNVQFSTETSVVSRNLETSEHDQRLVHDMQLDGSSAHATTTSK